MDMGYTGTRRQMHLDGQSLREEERRCSLFSAQIISSGCLGFTKSSSYIGLDKAVLVLL